MSTSVNLAARNSISIVDQRTILKVFFLENLTASAAHRKLVGIMGTNALSESSVKFWFQRFRSGDWSTEEARGNHSKPEETLDAKIRTVESAFEESRAWTVRTLSAKLEIPRSTLHRVMTESMGLRKISSKWVPHELSPSQMETRCAYSRLNLIEYNQQKSRLEHTVAIDESWISLSRPPERDQAREWLRRGEKPKTVVLPDCHGPKLMIILAMDYRGICYYELMETGEKVDGNRYLRFLINLMETWRGNRRHPVWLIDDNARPHRAQVVKAWIEQNKIGRWIHPPYSPDLSPCDYGCFHALKRAIGGVAYADAAALRLALDKEIMEGSRNNKYQAVQRLPERWQRCINVSGEYL